MIYSRLMVIDRLQDILCPELLINNWTKRELSSSSDEFCSSPMDHKRKTELVFSLKGVTVYWRKQHTTDNTMIAEYTP